LQSYEETSEKQNKLVCFLFQVPSNFGKARVTDYFPHIQTLPSKTIKVRARESKKRLQAFVGLQPML